jgi:hypothetical protein
MRTASSLNVDAFGTGHRPSTLANPYDLSWTRHLSLACKKKVNHEMPAERFLPPLEHRSRAHFVSPANWARMRVRK